VVARALECGPEGSHSRARPLARVIARSEATKQARGRPTDLDRFAAHAMTAKARPGAEQA
jgi:hypothetical protein